MSSYVRDIVIKRQFQEDAVTIVMRPVKFGDALRFSEIDTTRLAPKDLVPFMNDMKGYVKTFSGLKANDATDVTIDELFEAAYFLDFLTGVLEEWLEKSIPTNPPSAGALPNGLQPA